MIKKLCTILLSALLAAPLWAQPAKGDKDGVVFAPRKGQWQISLVLGGSNSFYNENTGSYLLPAYNNAAGSIGLPNGGTGGILDKGSTSGDVIANGNQSGYLNDFLQINGFNNNSLVNIVGLQAKYFFNDCWDVNFSLGMNINVTPKKDYIEGDNSVADMVSPNQKYVNAQTTNNWYANVGTERYFKTGNPRIHPYIGATVGFQMARIETMEPYTGKIYMSEDDDNEDEAVDQQVYLPAGKVGQMFGIKGALVGGIEYSLANGFVIGFECQPLAYRYDIIQIAPKGFDKYNLSHHNIKIIDMPVLKLGFRF